MWHAPQWARLLANGRASLGRLPHALLLSGVDGLGKRIFANQLAAFLLCESTAADGLTACGSCEACRWLKEGNHPDFRRLSASDEDADEDASTESKEKRKGAAQIKIAAVRALEDFVFVGSHRHGNRVVVIEQAEAMNPAAANALLKILEEPPASVYFLLTTNRPRSLLATIRSRCRVVSFDPPHEDEWAVVRQELGLPSDAVAGLALAGGAPFKLLEWQRDGLIDALEGISQSVEVSGPKEPLGLAATWEGLLRRHARLDMEMLVGQVLRIVFDSALSDASGRRRYLPAASKPVPNQATRFWPELLRFRRSARHPLNPTLFLEDLATQTLRALRKESP